MARQRADARSWRFRSRPTPPPRSVPSPSTYVIAVATAVPPPMRSSTSSAPQQVRVPQRADAFASSMSLDSPTFSSPSLARACRRCPPSLPSARAVNIGERASARGPCWPSERAFSAARPPSLAATHPRPSLSLRPPSPGHSLEKSPRTQPRCCATNIAEADAFCDDNVLPLPSRNSGRRPIRHLFEQQRHAVTSFHDPIRSSPQAYREDIRRPCSTMTRTAWRSVQRDDEVPLALLPSNAIFDLFALQPVALDVLVAARRTSHPFLHAPSTSFVARCSSTSPCLAWPLSCRCTTRCPPIRARRSYFAGGHRWGRGTRTPSKESVVVVVGAASCRMRGRLPLLLLLCTILFSTTTTSNEAMGRGEGRTELGRCRRWREWWREGGWWRTARGG